MYSPVLHTYCNPTPSFHVSVCWSAEVLTSSWSDGTPGPIAFCCPDGALSVSEIQEFNASHVASAMVVPSGTNSHFMTSDTLLQVWEQLYSPALAKQRSRSLSLCNGCCATFALYCPTTVLYSVLYCNFALYCIVVSQETRIRMTSTLEDLFGFGTVRYGLKLDDPGAEAAFLADAWSGTHSSSKGEDARRPEILELYCRLLCCTYCTGVYSTCAMYCTFLSYLGDSRICTVITLTWKPIIGGLLYCIQYCA